jgi:hypothetical protein
VAVAENGRGVLQVMEFAVIQFAASLSAVCIIWQTLPHLAVSVSAVSPSSLPGGEEANGATVDA